MHLIEKFLRKILSYKIDMNIRYDLMICFSRLGVFYFCFSFCRRPKAGLGVDFDLECLLVYCKTSCTFMLIALPISTGLPIIKKKKIDINIM